MLTKALEGQQVVRADLDGSHRLVIRFLGGLALRVQADSGGLVATLNRPTKISAANGVDQQPTKRQFEYLAFFAKYIARFGRAPAKSDIERHFLVSAPSVNQMMQTLERRGFIARQRGVPRSVRICIELPQREA
jgi:repressor LexA